MKKNKKGFTLVEVIVAMAVFAIMALLVCTLYAFLGKMVYKSNSMNTKVDSQVADYEKDDDLTDDYDSTGNITFNLDSTNINVPINIKTLDNGGTDNNPDIKYFYKP